MVKTKDELMASIKSKFGDDTSDETITLLEDISDTLDTTKEGADWKKKFRETQSAEEKASAEKAEREAQRQAEYEALVRKDKIHDLTETFMDQGYGKELAKKAAASLVDGDNDTLLECQKQFNAQLIAGEKEKWIASRPEINAGTGNAAETDPFLAGFNSVPTRFGH